MFLGWIQLEDESFPPWKWKAVFLVRKNNVYRETLKNRQLYRKQAFARSL